jgi:thiol-disulfide isomerase/thioredoxin
MNTHTSANHYGSQIRRKTPLLLLLGAASLLAVFAVRHVPAKELEQMQQKAPELTQIEHWINSDGLKLADQKGKVVALHFWTFGCINCQHNLPYYNKWQADFANEDVQIIGVHTPETRGEADPKTVAAQVARLKIKYPVAIDTDGATWKAYHNRYWPSIYLIDKQGQLRYRWEGELEFQDAGGDKLLRAKIKELLGGFESGMMPPAVTD